MIKQKFFYSICVLMFSFSSFCSCSNGDDDNEGNRSSIQVNDEVWYSSQYFENITIYHDDYWTFNGGKENCSIEITKADEEGAIHSDVLTLWAYSSALPKKGDDLAKSSTFFAVHSPNFMPYIFDYISGSATIIAVDDEYITVNLNNLKFSYKGSNSLPSGISEELTVKGTVKCYIN